MTQCRALTIVVLAVLTAFHAAAFELTWKPESTWNAKKRSSVPEFIDKATAAAGRGRYKKAIKYYRKVEKKSVNLHNRAMALLAQADCYSRRKQPWDAYKQYRKAVDQYGNFIPFAEILRREYEIANIYFAGKRDRFLVFSFSTETKAIEIYDHVAAAGPYVPFAPEAMYRSGMLSMQINDYQIAADKFKQIIVKYPRDRLISDVRIDLARCYIVHSNHTDGDGTYLAQAMFQLNVILRQDAKHSRVDEARELLATAREIEAERLLYLGRFYLRQPHRRLSATRRYLNTVIQEYPDTVSAGYAQELAAIVDSLSESVKP